MGTAQTMKVIGPAQGDNRSNEWNVIEFEGTS